MYTIYEDVAGIERKTTAGHEDLVHAIEQAVNMAAFNIRHSKQKLSLDTANGKDESVVFQIRIYRTQNMNIVSRIRVKKED